MCYDITNEEEIRGFKPLESEAEDTVKSIDESTDKQTEEALARDLLAKTEAELKLLHTELNQLESETRGRAEGMVGSIDEYTDERIEEDFSCEEEGQRRARNQIRDDEGKLFLVLFCLLAIAYGVSVTTKREKTQGACCYAGY